MAGSIRDQVAVVGVGCCSFGENWDRSIEDMIVDATYEAYADAGIEDPQRQIEAVFCASLYPSRGTAEVADALKLHDRPVTLVQNYCASGTDAFRCAVHSVACGAHETVLVVGFDKPKDRGVSGVTIPLTGVRDLPSTPAGWFALCAARYFEAYGATREDLARIAVKNHANGVLSPKAMLRRAITLDDALSARMICWPFGLYDCAAQSDGAAAVVITSRAAARRHRDAPVLVRAVAIALAPDPRSDADTDYLGWKATQYAARQAYAQAGIADPFREIHLAQVHDCFTLTELLAYEDLGFVPKGAAPEHIRAGTFERAGHLPVNTDGGLKAFGHPTGATGVRMIVESVLQLEGRAGPRQVGRPTVALTHNIGGAPQACGVAILGLP